MNGHYILIDREPVDVPFGKWAFDFENTERHVAEDNIGGVRISTVFLGLDHSFTPDGPPILFETMIFGGEHDEFQERYATWTEAEEGHGRAVALVRGDLDRN